MKRAAAVLIGLLLVSTVPAEATPIETGEAFNIAFSAETCTTCWSSPVPSVTIEGVLTVVPVVGAALWDPLYQDYGGGGLLITGISGTLNIDCLGIGGCESQGTYPVSFVPANPGGDGWSAPLGDGSYVFPDSGYTPRYVVFAAEGSGSNTRFFNDNLYTLFQWSSPVTKDGTQVPVTWNAVRVPEPSSLWCLAVGLIGFRCLKRTRSSRDSRSMG